MDCKDIENNSILDDKLELTSLCPSLGKRYSVITYGMCPSNLQNPHGKVLQISVTGSSPYIIYNEDKEWDGGIEFEVVDMYAKKFGFIPKFIRAPSWEGEGGVIDLVRNIHVCHHSEVFFAIFILQVSKKVCEIGIAPVTMFPHRYKIIDYLPHLYVYNYLVQSQKPQPITSIDALYYPLDQYTWYFTLSSSAAVLILLVIIQKCWDHANGQKSPEGWLFQGILLVQD